MYISLIWQRKKWWILITAIILILIVAGVVCWLVIDKTEGEKPVRRFPATFQIGAGSSSLQIEGAWNKDGKGPSIWDTFTHSHPNEIVDHSKIDDSCRFYDFFMNDIQLMKQIGLKWFRFSISWPRILSNGKLETKNEKGLEFYDRLIDELIANDIQPFVTIFHFDLPQALENIGGWLNPEIIDYFEQYADVVFDRYGDRVKYWATHNEPIYFCYKYYGENYLLFNNTNPSSDMYQCGHNALLAHAKAYHLYRKKYASKFEGYIGMVNYGDFVWPKNASRQEDRDAAERAMEMTFGWFVNPIYGENGDYPEIMRQTIAEKSKQENRSASRLPTFTKDELSFIRGTSDYLGLNFYDASLAEPLPANVTTQPHAFTYADQAVLRSFSDDWPTNELGWVIVPNGLHELLKRIKMKYNNPRIIITENGYGGLNDDNRMKSIQSHLTAILNAIEQDDCRADGYYHWSLFDSFEFKYGYTAKFGLIKVDFDAINRTRTLKKSATFLGNIAKSSSMPLL